MNPLVCEVLHRQATPGARGQQARYAQIVEEMDVERIQLGDDTGKTMTLDGYVTWLTGKKKKDSSEWEVAPHGVLGDMTKRAEAG